MEKIIEYMFPHLANDKVAVMCGHYPLVVENGKVVPGIYQSLSDEKGKERLREHPYSSEFPMESFRFGLEFLQWDFEEVKFVSLVNDWMFVPKNAEGDNSPNLYRATYYSSPLVPEIYLQELHRGGYDEKIYLEVPKEYRLQDNKIHFSETRLRNIFDIRFTSVTCPLGNSCAQEFVPFLQGLSRAGVKKFVACIPATCKEPTLAGIRYALNTLRLDMEIWSVYIYYATDLARFWKDVWIYRNGEFETVM